MKRPKIDPQTRKRLQQEKRPRVGDGATVLYWTDRAAGTVVEVSKTGHRIRIRRDKATATEGSNPFTGPQDYTYQPDPDGAEWVATIRFRYREDGSYAEREAGIVPGWEAFYKLVGYGSYQQGGSVAVGVRDEYYDPSF